MKFTAPVFILKQQAKVLSRKEKIPLHQALDRIASREGFNSWSLLAAKAASERPSERFLERLNPGDLALIAARPGQGKTLFSLELAVEAMRQGNRAAFFTLEVTQANVARCFDNLDEKLSNFTDKLLIDDSDQICADYIATRLASAPAKMLVIIDYLQLLDQNFQARPVGDEEVAAFAPHQAGGIELAQRPGDGFPSRAGMGGDFPQRRQWPHDPKSGHCRVGF